MAITTNDGLTAALAAATERDFWKAAVTAEAVGQFHSFWMVAGNPGAAVAPASGLNGEALSNATVGTLPFVNPVATGYLGMMEAEASTVGEILVCDRLWQNSGLVVATTTAQAIGAPVAIPARDVNGTTNGDGVRAFIEVITATTNAGVINNTTMSYTNQAGVAGRTGTLNTFPATAVAGTTVPFNLQAGDSGVRSVQSVTLGTSYGGGSISLVLQRKIATIGVMLVGPSFSKNFYDLGGPKLYSGSALFLRAKVSATAFGPFGGMIKPIDG